jgi:hypothetical protein
METFVLSEGDSALVQEAAADISGTMEQREIYGFRPA